jgi:hypothetical protein
MAGYFAVTAGGHGGSLLTDASSTTNLQPLVTPPKHE